MAVAPTIISFVANTQIKSADVNTNFTNLATWLSTNAVTADGQVPFTAAAPQCSVTPTIDDHLTRKGYVDARFAAKSGYQLFLNNAANVTLTAPVSGVAQETTLATVDSTTAIPVNATHPGLVLVATASCELRGGNGNATFLGTVEVSFDNGTTWETARRVNAVASVISPAAEGYGGLTVQTFASKASYTTASIVKARFKATQRASFSTQYSAESIQLALEVRREVPLA